MSIVAVTAISISYTVHFSVDRDAAKLMVKCAKKRFKTYKPSWYTDLIFRLEKKKCVEFPMLFRHNTIGSFLKFLLETEHSLLADVEEDIRSQLPFNIT